MVKIKTNTNVMTSFLQTMHGVINVDQVIHQSDCSPARLYLEAGAVKSSAVLLYVNLSMYLVTK